MQRKVYQYVLCSVQAWDTDFFTSNWLLQSNKDFFLNILPRGENTRIEHFNYTGAF